MGTLRKPFFIAATVLAVIIVLIELGGGLLLKGSFSQAGDPCNLMPDAQTMLRCTLGKNGDINFYRDQIRNAANIPGLGIPYLILLDSMVLFTLIVMWLALSLPGSSYGRTVGIISLIYSIIFLLAGIVMIFTALGKVLFMVGLFLSVPFGTIAYMAAFGFFPRGGALTILSLLFLLKIGTGACLVLAQQRFIQNKSLVLLMITTLIANLIIAFLIGLVPFFLDSITDGIGAIIAAILGVIWLIISLISAITSIVRAAK